MDEIVSEGCVIPFETYVGTAYVDSELYLDAMTPTAEGWAQGDHEVLCVLFPSTGTMNYDAKGSGR